MNPLEIGLHLAHVAVHAFNESNARKEQERKAAVRKTAGGIIGAIAAAAVAAVAATDNPVKKKISDSIKK